MFHSEPVHFLFKYENTQILVKIQKNFFISYTGWTKSHHVVKNLITFRLYIFVCFLDYKIKKMENNVT